MARWNEADDDLINSHVYRVPAFKNEVVEVVGNSMSGEDISMELTKVAKEVHLSSKDLNITQGLSKVIAKRSNLYLRPVIESMDEDGRVFFIDGCCVVADTIIYATGYLYSLPFLDTKGIVSVEDNRVGPLYEHTFPPLLAPSLSFVGIPIRVIAFPFFESQAKWVAQVLSGKKKLPSVEEMMICIEEFYRSRESSGIPKRHTHHFLPSQVFEYSDWYADISDSPHLEDWRKELCLSRVVNYYSNLENFRDSYDHDHDLLQLAYNQSSHFTKFTVG